MAFYLITLTRLHTDETLQWIKDWLAASGNEATITIGSTDKQEHEVILLELEGDLDDPDGEFEQHLHDDEHVLDYIFYVTGEE